MADMPWFKFYPSDWLGNGLLRLAPHNVKGFYMDLLCIMFDCENRGRLEAGGVPLTEEEIAGAVNGNPIENLAHLRWLTFKGILSKDERGVIYSRRMVKDEARRKAGSEAGKRGGGNPELSKDDTSSQTYIGKSKGSPKGDREKPIYLETRDQILDTRSQKSTTPTPPTPSPGELAAVVAEEKNSGEGDPETNARFRQWGEIQAELRNLGMVAIDEPMDNLQVQGLTPDYARAVLAHWRSKPDDYWPNPVVALRSKLVRAVEGEEPDAAWLQPADKYLKREANAQATQERQQARQREIEAKPETKPEPRPRVDPERLESEFGGTLNGMTSEERESFFEESAANSFELDLFRKKWKSAGGTRRKLLGILAESTAFNTS